MAADVSGDIVERLRRVDVSWSETGEWCAEAADEIERLRTRLEVVPGFSDSADGISCRDDTIRLQDERINRLRTALSASQAEVGMLREALGHLVHDMDDLIANSEGVSGLHLNGDIAEWESLEAGGSCEPWLGSLNTARLALNGGREDES